jgi:hypothetical protein
MIFYLLAIESTNGFNTTDIEVFLFSNESDAKALSIKKREQNPNYGRIQILPLELDKILNNPNCIFGESLDIY